MILNLGKVAKRWFDCCFVQLLVKPAKNVCLGGPSKRRTVLDRLFILAEALAHGLVSRVVEHESLHDEVTSIAEQICQKSRSVLAIGKSTFYRQIIKDRNSAYV